MRVPLKVLLWLIIGIVSLLVIVIIALQVPFVQNYIAGRATTYLSEKIDSKVELESINIGFPKTLNIKGLYIEDQRGDTLLYAGNLNVGVDMMRLLRNELTIRSVGIDRLTANIYRLYPDTTFNYSYIPAAFASKEPPAEESTEGSSFVISIKAINLNDIRLLYNDTLTGLSARAYLGEFETVFNTFDLQKLIFKVNDISLLNSTVAYIETTPLIKNAPPSTEPAEVVDLAFEQLKLSNFHANYNSKPSGNDLKAFIAELQIEAESVNMSSQRFAINSFVMAGADINFAQSKPQHFDTVVAQVMQEQGIEKQRTRPEWIFTLDELQLNNNKFSYKNLDSTYKKQGIDFNNLVVSDFIFKSTDLYVSPGKIDLSLDEFSFSEKSGFKLDEFSTKISYDTTHVTLSDLIIATPNSRIGDHIDARFSSIAELTKSIEKVKVDINLVNTSIAVADILFVMPELINNPQLALKGEEVFDLDGRFTGTLKSMNINDFQLSNNIATRVKLNGQVNNLMNPEALYANVDNIELHTTRDDILMYIAEKLIPQTISIPETIDISGEFKGYLKNFNGIMNVETSYGNMKADVKMDPAQGNREVRYLANLSTDNFDLGKLLKQPDTLGPVSLVVSIDGTGMDPENIDAMVKAKVIEAYYNQYAYKDLDIEGHLVRQSFDGTVMMKDDNLDFTYKGYVNMNPDSLALQFALNLGLADLQALNLSKTPFKVRGLVNSNIAQGLGPNPTGKLKIHDVQLLTDGLDCPMDSLVVLSTFNDSASIISINSSVINGEFKGRIKLTELAASLTRHMDSYFGLAIIDTINRQTLANIDTNLYAQNFEFNVVVEDPHKLCKDLLPTLKKFSPVILNGRYNSNAMELIARLDVPLVDYNGIVVDSLYFDITSDDRKLDYHLHAIKISNASAALDDFHLDGDIAGNKIIYNFSAQKGEDYNVLTTSGAFTGNDSTYLLILDEPLVLNNQPWSIDPDNVITFSDAGLDAQKVVISGEGQVISILTQPGEYVPLQITFDDFNLANLSQIIENETELARGTLDGVFTLFNINGTSAFTSDLEIDSLSFMKVPVGHIELLADNSKNSQQFDVDFRLTGNDNDLTIKGFYLTTTEEGTINMKVNIPRLSMATIEPFTFGAISRMKGYLTGGMDIGGSTTNPEIMGELGFNEVGFNAAFTDSYMLVGDNTIQVKNDRLVLDQFTLTDTLSNTAILNGYVDFANLQEPRYDLRIKTEDFLAMNSGRKKDVSIFGKVLLDSDIHAVGTPLSPVVDLKAQLNDGTSVTFVMPDAQAGTMEREGIVEFVDSLYYNQEIASADTTISTRSSIEGVALDAAITFEPEAVLKMLIDPITGDSLFVRGSGTLNFSLDPGGQTNLTGRYNITEGGYNITLNELLKRQFSISEGSSITWNGEIMDATVDISAIYKVKTSPMILLEDQTEGMEESDRNASRNTLNFLVILKMSGSLMKPVISFDIEQPDNEKGAIGGTVNDKLAQLRTDETQLNKQVFALLALNRFLGQDPFETGNAPMTLESATRSSASKLLTQQFSALSEKYIKGVDLDVGVTSFEDYSSGTPEGRTQLQLGVSKQFLDERINVQVGGNVELEGERASSNNASNIAGNVNVEYKLTSNGRYRLKGFRRSEYEIPEGEVVKTGIGLIYSRDFRKIRQLFTKNKNRQEIPTENETK